MAKTVAGPKPQPSAAYGNYYNKYESRNPIARLLMRNFHSQLSRLISKTDCHELHEVGCGEGNLTRFIDQQGYQIRGSDYSAEVIALAQQQSELANRDICYKAAAIESLNKEVDSAEVMLCCEVLEHVSAPHAALSKLAELASPYLIVTVPREPIWRILNMLRGKYLRDLGNTPGHINHWSTRQFINLLEEHVDILEVTQPLPWTFALCRSRNALTDP